LDLISEAERIRKNSLERIGFYAEDLAASNNWVISGKRTLDGKPILANDPHLRPSQPPIWYMVHLAAPNVKVAGVTSAGAPGVLLGHNEHFAWGATNVGPDVQDLYIETFNEKNQYRTPKGWTAPTIRKEEIKIRKNPLSPETESEILEVVSTRNGVIFAESDGKKYALKWTAFDPKLSTFDAFFYINYAKNWEEFKRALEDYGGSMQNFVYADVKGNIGWYAAGKVPIRKTGDGSLPYDGASGAGEWTGFIPFEELPHLYNPPEGFIVTANQRTIGKSYKYHDLIARIYVPFRAKRIYDLIAANGKMTLNDSSDIQMDTFSILNSRFAREIVNSKAASDETVKILQGWDGRMNPDSHAALLADEIRIAFRNRLLAGNFGEPVAGRLRWANEGNFLNKIITEKPKNWLPKGVESYADLLKASEVDAREKLIKNLGIDRAKWTWGESAKARFPHALVSAPLIGLQFNTPVLPAKGSGSQSASPNVNSAVSMRLLAQPPDWDLTRQVITTGQSGNPKSPHWADQLDDWYQGTTPIFPFSDSAVKSAAKETVLLMPK
jgi:penicillin G amidase